MAAITDASPADLGRIAVVVVNYRTPDLVRACVAALAAQRPDFTELKLVVVDGASGDGSAERIAADLDADGHTDWVTLLALPVNGGFGYANNQAILTLAAAGPLPPVIALINPDAAPLPGALRTMADHLARHPRAGAVGALLVHEDGEPQGSAFPFPSLRGEFCRAARTDALRRLLGEPPSTVRSDTAIQVPWVTGAAVAFRTAALAEVGLFDDGFFLYFEETELMLRLTRAGWDIWHEPAARVMHLAGKSTQLRDAATGNMAAKRLPAYWYEARRRYFVRAGGPAMALGAGIAWLAGRGLWRVRRLLSGRREDGPPLMTRDMLALSTVPRGRDRRRAPLPDFSVAPGAKPLWMDG
jgi:N-acetylglucosaminyl-diphospho-decaprenol L-rhamnosyltransferase